MSSFINRLNINTIIAVAAISVCITWAIIVAGAMLLGQLIGGICG